MPAVQVAKLIDTTLCIGCKACEVACQEWNDQEFTLGTFGGTYQTMPQLEHNFWNLIKFNERETDAGMSWLMAKFQCMHCADAGCMAACPAPGAINRLDNGTVDFNHDNCIGCGYCITGCPFNIPRLSPVTQKVSKCTLCSDRVAFDQEPACSKACPTKAIVFGTKEEMIHHAEERITDLKSRGFENAGLYDPQGVGGTHVMYVLHHADQPQLYANLPKDPKIDPFVELWKGNLKLGGLFAIGAAAVVAFVHHLITGANRVQPEDEVKADELVKDKV